MKAAIAKRKQGKHEEDDEAESKPRGPKRGLEHDERSAASGSKPKAPRIDDDAEKNHEDQLRRLNVKAPTEFLKFFPLVSYCYFKWLPKNFRVTVEFVQKERFLAFIFIHHFEVSIWESLVSTFVAHFIKPKSDFEPSSFSKP